MAELSLEDAIANLPELLRKKQKQIEEREESLKKAEAIFKTEKDITCCS
jgi:hypothetical protein